MAQAILIRHARVFDGFNVLPESDVLVEQGVITAVGLDIIAPVDAELIDGAGKTLLPGLIDAHTHTFGTMLREALIFGVTTELDMFTDYHMAAEMRRKEIAGENTDMADIRSAGTLVTAPGGHGTEYGLPIPTITSPAEAQDFVDARIAEGSDYIKIVYDSFGGHIPTISKEIMAAVVEAAHKRDKLTVVHISTLQDARDAIEVGADGLAHLFVDRSPDAEFGRFVAEHHAFVIPTLTVLESLAGVASGASLVTDTRLAPYLTKENVGVLQTHFTIPERVYTAAEEAIRQLKAAGVPILAGTDAPNPGTAHGASIHREMELLVQAGLTPLEALTAATAMPARIFGLTDRGRIAAGLYADLVLVEGDPTEDILATRAIVSVWKRGVAADRASYRAEIERRRKEDAERQPPAGSENGLVSDFEDGTTRTAFGAGWAVTTDSVMGGSSTAEFRVVPEGVNGGKGSLLITGEVAQAAFPWAGVNFYPGPAPFTPANLSTKQGLSFWTKGDGRGYRVLLFASGMMGIPPSVAFATSSAWQEYHFAFSDFGKIDSHELLAISFVSDTTRGTFAFQIDDVRFE